MNIKVSVLTKAISVAKKSDVVRGKVGAVIFTRSGNIIASASNTIFYRHKGKWTIHAEEAAIRKIINLRHKHEFGQLYILVVRYKAGSDTLGISRPCPKCQTLLKWAGIRVFHTNTDGNIVEFEE